MATDWSFEERKQLMVEVTLAQDPSNPFNRPVGGDQEIYLCDPVKRCYLYTTGAPFSVREFRVPIHVSRNTTVLWRQDDFPQAYQAVYEFCVFKPLLPEMPESKWYVYTEGPRFWEVLP